MELTVIEQEAIERGVLVLFVLPDSEIECVAGKPEVIERLRQAKNDHSQCGCAVTYTVADVSSDERGQ